VSKKKEEAQFMVAVFRDGKILVTSDSPLTKQQIYILGDTIKNWYNNGVPAALCIPNATMFYVPEEPGGDTGTFAMATPVKTDTTGMN